MARKDVLLGISGSAIDIAERSTSGGYARRGASKSMLSSIGELAAQAAKAEKLLEGDSVIEISPEIVDASFVADRLDDGETGYAQLVAAIRERGQDTPILVRPHPDQAGRYMVVFGHRRLKAARELGRPVKAVVRTLEDIQHVVAQGQENSARENLSFIERSVFAQQLANRGFDRPTIETALSVDAPMLTRMLSVTKRIPSDLLQILGAAKSIGRDRWIELATLLENPHNQKKATAVVASEAFIKTVTEDRFDFLLREVKSTKKPGKQKGRAGREWTIAEGGVAATARASGRQFVLELKADNAADFGRYLSDRLDELYGSFLNERTLGKGD